MRRWRTRALVCERDLERLHPLMHATPVPRRRLRRGTVVLARVPFQDLGPDERPEAPRDKVRPVVVLRVNGDEVSDLVSAGLTRPTGVRRRRITLPVDAFLQVRGVLAECDLARVLGGPRATAALG